MYVVDLKVGDRASTSVVEDGGIEAALFLPNGQALRREPPAGPDGEKDFEIAAETSGSYRLKDFNNLDSTEFRDIKTVLTIAIHRIRQRLG